MTWVRTIWNNSYCSFLSTEDSTSDVAISLSTEDFTSGVAIFMSTEWRQHKWCSNFAVFTEDSIRDVAILLSTEDSTSDHGDVAICCLLKTAQVM